VVEVEHAHSVAPEQELARLAVAVHRSDARWGQQALGRGEPVREFGRGHAETPVDRADAGSPLAEPRELAVHRALTGGRHRLLVELGERGGSPDDPGAGGPGVRLP
jgi:hypothetical protein